MTTAGPQFAPRLDELLRAHLQRHALTTRDLAKRLGLVHSQVEALLIKGSLPRKREYREALRSELGLQSEAWGLVLAASQRDPVNIPTSGPLTLQQQVVKSLLAQGYTEQTFATATGVAYPTLLGLTRKGAVPRTETLLTIARHLGLDEDEIVRAAGRTKTMKQDQDEDMDKDEQVSSTVLDGAPNLAQLVSDLIIRRGSSVAAFARANDLPYVSLMNLIKLGQPPRRKAVLEALAKALDAPEETFASALAKSKMKPMPAEAPRQSDNAVNPFHAALLRLVEEKGFNTKAFAEAADLSVLTAAKLIKRGELPGRATTHEKLRNLLGLTEIAYRDLLASSRQVDDGRESEHAPTAEYLAVGSGLAPANTTKGELFELIDRLSPGQLVTLKNFLLSVL